VGECVPDVAGVKIYDMGINKAKLRLVKVQMEVCIKYWEMSTSRQS